MRSTTVAAVCVAAMGGVQAFVGPNLLQRPAASGVARPPHSCGQAVREQTHTSSTKSMQKLGVAPARTRSVDVV